MRQTKRKMLLTGVILTASAVLVWAENPGRISVNAAETAAQMVQKLNSDVTLNVEQQTPITELTISYLNERQVVLDSIFKGPIPEELTKEPNPGEALKDSLSRELIGKLFSEETIRQFKEIEDRYQERLNQLLSAEQRETVSAKCEERKNELFQEARAATTTREQQIESKISK